MKGNNSETFYRNKAHYKTCNPKSRLLQHPLCHIRLLRTNQIRRYCHERLLRTNQKSRYKPSTVDQTERNIAAPRGIQTHRELSRESVQLCFTSAAGRPWPSKQTVPTGSPVTPKISNCRLSGNTQS